MTDDKAAQDSRQRGPGASVPVPVRDTAPNPQGKGVVGFLRDWEESAPRALAVKRPGQILADYFTSLLVLSAAFKFKPAFGQTYHLYRDGSKWVLSLISPAEWNTDRKREGYVGACVLHEDSTWTIEPSANLGKPGPIADALAAMYEGFLAKLDTRQPLEKDLPIYEGRMPYYQRLFASALSRSLKGSLAAGGQTGQPANEWLESLPHDAGKLLIQPADRTEE